MSGTVQGGLKSSKGGCGDPYKASPAAIERYLKGIHFPSDKEGLISCAEKNKAPDDVLYVLRKFYADRSAIDISKETHSI